LQDLVSIGDQLDVDVDRRLPPAVKHRGCSAGDVDVAIDVDGTPQLAHEPLDPGGVG
jgi:hypothetical protein